MSFLTDYNLDGYALVFLGVLTKRGWLEFLPIRFVTFKEAGLSMDSSDRVVWRYAQANQMDDGAHCQSKYEGTRFARAGYTRGEHSDFISRGYDWGS